MVLVRVSIHPSGLAPAEAAKAWYLRTKEKAEWKEIRAQCVNAKGKTPSMGACRTAVARMCAVKKKRQAVPTTNYANCGRNTLLTEAEEKKVLDFVKKWRHKRFCVAKHIVAELKLKCSARTVARCLNRKGYAMPTAGPGDGEKRDFNKNQNNFVELSPPPPSGLAHVALASRSKFSAHRLVRFRSRDGRAGCVKRKRKTGSGTLSPPPPQGTLSRNLFTPLFENSRSH